MKNLSLMMLVLSTGQAAADPGHLVAVAGHDHWVAGLAIGAAAVVGLWGAMKGQNDGTKTQGAGDCTDGSAEPDQQQEA